QAGSFNRHVRTQAPGAKILLEEAMQNMVAQNGIVLHLVAQAGGLIMREDMLSNASKFSPALAKALSFMGQETSTLQ
ncbi:hypothetical protein JG666_25190, partial [Vibrio cholerae]|nr:hypothetical protein [Vibrio cholerae]